MQCPNCNENIQSGSDTCPHCDHELAVTVLSRQDRDSFNGVTIEDNSQAGRDKYSSYDAGSSPQFKKIHLSFGSSGIIGNLLVAAFLAALLFFFLPILMIVLLVIGAVVIGVWLLRRLIK